MFFIHMAQYRDKRRAPVYMVMNFIFHKMYEIS